MKESSNLRKKIVNVNQTFRGHSLFISGLKATFKKGSNFQERKQLSRKKESAFEPMMKREYPRNVWLTFTIFVRKFELSFTFHNVRVSCKVRGKIGIFYWEVGKEYENLPKSRNETGNIQITTAKTIAFRASVLTKSEHSKCQFRFYGGDFTLSNLLDTKFSCSFRRVLGLFSNLRESPCNELSYNTCKL